MSQHLTEERFMILQEINTRLYLDNTDHIVFVYCPPKLGSTSIVSSIRISASNIFKVFHVHDEKMLEMVTGVKNVTIQEIIDFNVLLGKKVYVIDIYREPIERKMSEFFGKIASYHFNAPTSRVEAYSMDRIIKRFNQVFTHIGNGDYFFEKYRDVIMNPPKGFDFDKGYIKHKQYENLTYIKLRLRDSHKWGHILTEILNTKITIIRDYERKNLPLANLYAKFKQAYKIPINFIHYMHMDNYMRFYLSTKERDEYLSKWSENTSTPFNDFTTTEYKLYLSISDENQSYIDIESEHYFDEGCTCKSCEAMRKKVLLQILQGKEPTTRIAHSAIMKLARNPLAVAHRPQIPAPPSSIPVKSGSNMGMMLRTNRFRR